MKYNEQLPEITLDKSDTLIIPTDFLAHREIAFYSVIKTTNVTTI